MGAIAPILADIAFAGNTCAYSDLRLIYQVEGNIINFVRAGSHADLFEE
jgi:hypothetical protein